MKKKATQPKRVPVASKPEYRLQLTREELSHIHDLVHIKLKPGGQRVSHVLAGSMERHETDMSLCVKLDELCDRVRLNGDNGCELVIDHVPVAMWVAT